MGNLAQIPGNDRFESFFVKQEPLSLISESRMPSPSLREGEKMNMIKDGAAHAARTLSLLACLSLISAPAFADTGDTAWMLTSTALVLFMTLPGLALFYGGLVQAKNVLWSLGPSLPHSSAAKFRGIQRLFVVHIDCFITPP